MIEEPIVEEEPEPEEEPVVEEPEIDPEDIGVLGVDYIEMTVRLNTTLSQYESDGGDDNFKNIVCSSLEIENDKLLVMEVTEGSVIVRFRVFGSPGLSLDNLQDLLTNRFQDGQINPGYPVLDASFTPLDPS